MFLFQMQRGFVFSCGAKISAPLLTGALECRSSGFDLAGRQAGNGSLIFEASLSPFRCVCSASRVTSIFVIRVEARYLNGEVPAKPLMPSRSVKGIDGLHSPKDLQKAPYQRHSARHSLPPWTNTVLALGCPLTLSQAPPVPSTMAQKQKHRSHHISPQL